MAFYETDRYVTVGEMLPYLSVPPNKGKEMVGDIAYDPLSFNRFPSERPGEKIYISPHPFVNRGGREVPPNLYIQEAIDHGASVVVYRPDDSTRGEKTPQVTFVEDDDPRRTLALAAAIYYGIDQVDKPIFAATGTKGKTTTTYMLRHLLNKIVGPTGLIGTADYWMGDRLVENLSPFINGTWLSCPEALELSGFIAGNWESGGRSMVLEATSHALQLHRVSKPLNLAGGVVTNLGSDHLDFHGTREAYRDAKGRIIDLIARSDGKNFRPVILNANDPDSIYFEERARMQGVPVVTVGFENKNAVLPIQYGLVYDTNTGVFQLNHGGESVAIPSKIGPAYNMLNIAMATALVRSVFELPISEIPKIFEDFEGVPGRFQVVQKEPFMVVVDFAHEETSLAALLEHIDTLSQNAILVMGCAGDRDKAKRPKMGELAARKAYFTIITNDSTNSEDPEVILRQIEAGYLGVRQDGYEVLDDRRMAIQRAIELAKPGDGVYILGMGSETILDRGGEIIPWSDVEVSREILNSMGLSQ